MWRNYTPGCAQFAAGGIFALVVLIAVIVVQLSPEPLEPTYQTGVGRVLEQYTFSSGRDGWRPLQAGDRATFDWDSESNAFTGRVRVNLGHATTTQDRQFRDIVIEGDVRLLPSIDGATASVGLTCRADADGNGYYFLLSSSGAASIRYGDPDQPDDLIPLSDWQRTDAVGDLTQPHTLRAICAGDYLALYVDDLFVTDATHSRFTYGYVGVALAGGTEADADISNHIQVGAIYDNITILQATGVGVR